MLCWKQKTKHTNFLRPTEAGRFFGLLLIHDKWLALSHSPSTITILLVLSWHHITQLNVYTNHVICNLENKVSGSWEHLSSILKGLILGLVLRFLTVKLSRSWARVFGKVLIPKLINCPPWSYNIITELILFCLLDMQWYHRCVLSCSKIWLTMLTRKPPVYTECSSYLMILFDMFTVAKLVLPPAWALQRQTTQQPAESTDTVQEN